MARYLGSRQSKSLEFCPSSTPAIGTILQVTATGTLNAVALGGNFGSGADGNVDLDGTNTYTSFMSTTGAAPNLVYTLTRDVSAANFTIRTGKVLNTASYRVFVSGTFTPYGTGVLRNNGNDGTAGSNGTATAAGSGHVGGAAVATGSLGGSGAGGTGGNGGAGGFPGGATPSVGAINPGLGGAGKTSGAGEGGNGGANLGGPNALGGTLTRALAAADNVSNGIPLLSPVSGTLFQIFGGTGGGGGGGGGGGSGSQGGAGGGGGGGGGGVIGLYAYSIDMVTGSPSGAVLTANGGNGAAGGVLTLSNGGRGSCGGGGGGGLILVMYRVLTGTFTSGTHATVTGGAIGSGFSNGGQAQPGADGNIYIFQA